MMFLTKVFKVILYRQYLPEAWKQSHMNCVLKPHTRFYHPICLLDTVESCFENTYS